MTWSLNFIVFQGIALLLICIALPSCALVGGEKEIQHAKNYEVSKPESWTETAHAESDKAYRLSSGNIVTLVSSCNRNSEAPLDILTKHLLMGTRNVTVVHREKRKLGQNDGLYTRLQARLEGRRIHLEIFVFVKNK